MATKPEDQIPGSAAPGWTGGTGQRVTGNEFTRNLSNAATALAPLVPIGALANLPKILGLGVKAATAAKTAAGMPAVSNTLALGVPAAAGLALHSAASQPTSPAPAPAPVPSPAAKAPAAPATPAPAGAGAGRGRVNPAMVVPDQVPDMPAPTGLAPQSVAEPQSVVDPVALQRLTQTGNVQQLPGGILAAGGLSYGQNGSFEIPWATPEPAAAAPAGVLAGMPALTPQPAGAAPTTPMDAWIAAEGAQQYAPLIKAIYGQESSSGKNPKTSNAGAVGGMQIIPETFNSVADKGWDIKNPEHNGRAGIRYLLEGLKAGGGDPRLAAAYYYSGPGGMAKAQKGQAVRDPINPTAPNTLEYADQVIARMGAAAGAPAPAAAPAAAPALVGTAGPRDGDIQVLRGMQSSWSVPEFGRSVNLQPEVYFDSLARTGGMQGAADLMRMGNLNAASPDSVQAGASVQVAQINAAREVQQAQINAAAQQAIEAAKRAQEDAQFYATPVPIGSVPNIINMPNGMQFPDGTLPTYGLPQRGGGVAPARPPATKPSLQQFLGAARAANPGASDAELSQFYKQRYGN